MNLRQLWRWHSRRTARQNIVSWACSLLRLRCEYPGCLWTLDPLAMHNARIHGEMIETRTRLRHAEEQLKIYKSAIKAYEEGSVHEK